MRRSALVIGLLALGGCDLLFPEFSGGHVDASIDDGGALPDGGTAGPHVAGSICALADLRDFRSCMTGHGGGFRVSVEETRDVTTADAMGNFVLPLSTSLELATVAAVDPTGAAEPTIVMVALRGGAADGVGLPIAGAQALQQAAALNGFSVDGTRGIVLAWAVDAQGTPVAGASAQAAGGVGVGPLYEGGAANELELGNTTGARGVVAWFDVPPRQLVLTLAAPANGALAGDQFTLPIRPGAVTITTLLLPPRS
ncbi:MAG TPA: hypothetical protein VFF06_18210 [Polyangia bacterium]|nr:hypothetical protein [Polyangia bacterium]